MRITKKQIDKLVDTLNELLGRPKTAYTPLAEGGVYENAGHIYADHNPIYGGYCLEMMVEGGGVTHFGNVRERVCASEMNNILQNMIFMARMCK